MGLLHIQKDDLICIGKIASPHGVHGKLKIHLFTESLNAILDYESITDINGNEITFSDISFRPEKSMMIALVNDISNRDDAQALLNKELFITRDQLAELSTENTENKEFYIADLIGLSVCEGTENNVIGKIIEMHNFGAGDIVEIKMTESQKELMFAFNKETFPVVDIENGYVIISRPEIVNANMD